MSLVDWREPDAGAHSVPVQQAIPVAMEINPMPTLKALGHGGSEAIRNGLAK